MPPPPPKPPPHCTHSSGRKHLFGFKIPPKVRQRTQKERKKKTTHSHFASSLHARQKGNACTHLCSRIRYLYESFPSPNNLVQHHAEQPPTAEKCRTHFPYILKVFSMPGACTLYLNACTKSSGCNKRINSYAVGAHCSEAEYVQEKATKKK